MNTGSCYKCGEVLKFDGVVGRRDCCPKCDSNVHCCKGCGFHDQNSYNECREPSADVVKDKEASNFCDYFSLGSSKTEGDSKDKALSAAEALFKKS